MQTKEGSLGNPVIVKRIQVHYRELLYIGQCVSPAMAFYISNAATKCADLHLGHVHTLNTFLRTVKINAATTTYLSSKERRFKLETMADVSI